MPPLFFFFVVVVVVVVVVVAHFSEVLQSIRNYIRQGKDTWTRTNSTAKTHIQHTDTHTHTRTHTREQRTTCFRPDVKVDRLVVGFHRFYIEIKLIAVTCSTTFKSC